MTATLNGTARVSQPADSRQQHDATTTPATRGRSIGLARVSTRHQSLGAQEAELKAAGCDVVHLERVSTRKAEADRPALQACLADLQPGDELVVVGAEMLGSERAKILSREALARYLDISGHVAEHPQQSNLQRWFEPARSLTGLLFPDRQSNSLSHAQ